MDTVKLDIQKLQLLNDRIAQTLEALNQVRLSVHGLQSMQGQGLQHSSPGSTVGSWGGGYNPYAQQGYGQQGFGGQQFGTQIPFGVPQIPFNVQAQIPFGGLQHSGLPFVPPQPFGNTGFVMPFGGGGIGHTSAGFDPTWPLRAMQTFPFVQYPYVPGMY